MNYFYLLIGLMAISASVKAQTAISRTSAEKPTIEGLIQNLEDSENKEIIVVAHRGDWRHAPENSLQAIRNCIQMGVDMVEIDIRKTSDGHLILMHDGTIDRTTNGKGRVSSLTLDELKAFKLRDGLGKTTAHEIPTLEEAMSVAKDKILINLDKSYSLFDECYEVLVKTNTLDQVIFKGDKTREKVEKDYGDRLDEIYFMPQIKLPNPGAKAIVDDYLENRPPIAFAFGIPQDTIQLIRYFDEIRKQGSSVWVNSLWKRHNGGHDDEKAALDPTVYDWYVENNIDIIQTDRPQLLLDYLKKKGLHR